MLALHIQTMQHLDLVVQAILQLLSPILMKAIPPALLYYHKAVLAIVYHLHLPLPMQVIRMELLWGRKVLLAMALSQ